ncbi:MAG: hypothetical protein PHU69_10780 [Fermentimonas sp.]|nr:hypothetical protein [Fermentimonas sp.]
MLKITSTVSLESIPHDTKIARYFTREKIDRLTKERTIWFANVKSFKDKHERQIPDAFFKDWPRDSVNSGL